MSLGTLSVGGGVAETVVLDPLPSHLNWTNQHGGPIVDRTDPALRFARNRPHNASILPVHASQPSKYKPSSNYSFKYYAGFLSASGITRAMQINDAQTALDACSADIMCDGVTYQSSGVNGTVTKNTTAYLKRAAGFTASSTWTAWLKTGAVDKPIRTLSVGGLESALRTKTFTVQWLNASRATHIANYSFVPTLTPGSALPLHHHLGDITLRVRRAGGSPAAWSFYSTVWGPYSAEATVLQPSSTDELAVQDVTPLLDATRVPDAPDGVAPDVVSSPVHVRRAYLDASPEQPGLGVSFTLTNKATYAVEIGGFGMSLPASVSQDVHMGGAHGWAEWMRVLISKELLVEGQCVVATPLNLASRLENFRPIYEFGGGGYEWSVHTAAWAAEWERNVQWPYLYMVDALNATGLWPHPRSPWPSWGDGGQTVRVNVTKTTHWNPPTAKVLAPGGSVTYGLRLLACEGGPRTRDAALRAAGEPILRGVPGYTLGTDMATAALFVSMPRAGVTVTGATSSDREIMHVGTPSPSSAAASTRIPVRGLARGRARVEVHFSDGSTAAAHYLVLPPLTKQIERVTSHWADVAWLPREYPDPFGRSASVMPWDREDRRHRLNDGRAYDVGLSDDAGAANNLGFATSQAYAPTAHAVGRLDEYITSTLYGVKTDVAKPPYKSLQIPAPNNGVRMTLFYYNQSYFPWNYTEEAECGVVGGLNYNWCMTEHQANATYRGFNYPHQIAVWYGMYRVARNHPHLKGPSHSWEFYLERAANTTLRLGWARIGYMDGTVTREVLRSILEEADEAANEGRADRTPWAALGAKVRAGEKGRADYFKTAPNPYGSEFSYDTTGQEEVVVWLLYFGYDDAASRTVEHVLQYMRPLPNWAYNGGAQAGDVANGGKWLVTAGTGRGDSGKMHYRAGLNQIPLIEWYRRHPDDVTTLEIAVGAVSGQMSNIDETGAPSIYFHDVPHIMEHDAYSGDYGLGFFGSSLESSAIFVLDKALGPLCYLCDLETSASPQDGGGSVYTIKPRDAYRQRVYLEPLGTFLQADTGVFASVVLALSARTITVTFECASSTPAHTQSYDVLRLRVDKTVVAPSSRPGSHFRVVSPSGTSVHRSAFEIAPPVEDDKQLTVVIGYDADDDDQIVRRERAEVVAASGGGGFPPLNNPCSLATPPFAAQPWCNATLPMAARIRDMIGRMTIDEKIGSLDTASPAIGSLGLNAYNWWSEATHGVSTNHVNATGKTPTATNFAFPITTVASFNRTLWRATGAHIAREARAFMNAGHGYSTFWTPVVNLAREPRWGRNLECAGEDPLLSGEYAVAFVHGLERLEEDPTHLATSACCKHYVANSMEDSRVAGVHHTRYSADPNISAQDLVDSYMAPFQMCVERGHVSSLMCSYNAVNGIPTCANPWLLNTIARGAWGFDGYIVSDCAAVGNVVAPHHYVKTAPEAAAVTLKAGMDIACATFMGYHGKAALDQGLITEALIDERLSNLFKVRMRLGHFDKPGPLQQITPSALCTPEAQATAREGSAQGAALFKNDKTTLPLDASSLKTLAVVGPNANLSQAMAGYYGPNDVCFGKFPAMLDAISHYVPHAAVKYAAGVPSVLSANTSGVAAAAALAKEADVTVLVLGTDLTVAKENHDAVNLTFSHGQLALVDAVTAVSARPVVVITLTAVPLDLTPLLTNPKVGAILHAGQPSIQTLGVADVLFGAVSPAGRAVQTVYPPAYQHMVSPFDFNMRPGPSRWPRPDSPGPCADPYVKPVVPSANCTLGTNPGRTYRFYNGEAVVPFGHGLSYTSWTYTIISAPPTASLTPLRSLLKRTAVRAGVDRGPIFPRLSEVGAAAQYTVNVTNTGKVDADDVVLGFISLPGAGQGGRPLKTLFGFERVHVRAGDTVSVYLYPQLTELAATLDDGAREPIAGRYTVSFGVRKGLAAGMGFAETGLDVVE